MADEQCGLGLSGQKNKACVWSYNGEFNLQAIKMNIEQVIGIGLTVSMPYFDLFIPRSHTDNLATRVLQFTL